MAKPKFTRDELSLIEHAVYSHLCEQEELAEECVALAKRCRELTCLDIAAHVLEMRAAFVAVDIEQAKAILAKLA